jgi:hypothetical protein
MNYLPQLALNYDPPISASRVARITGVSHSIQLCLTFRGVDKLFSKAAIPFYIPLAMQKGSSFSTSLPSF